MRTALRTATRSMSSWAMAPSIAGKNPKAAASMPKCAERHSPDCALQGDRTHATADVDEFVYFAERRLQDDGVSGFGGDIAVQAKG